MKEVVAIVGIVIVSLYALHKYWQWYNPYVDEIVQQGTIGGTSRGEKATVGDWYLIKRTWKNGKTIYINKTSYIS